MKNISIKISKLTKIKFIIALIVSILVFIIFDKLVYGDNCALKLSCMVGDISCEKKDLLLRKHLSVNSILG